MASQITGVSIVCSTVCSGADQRKHQTSATLAFVRGIHRWPSNSPHKGPVTRKMIPFDSIIMCLFDSKSSSGTHFTNDFSITIQMWWKFHFALIQILIHGSLQNLAHGTTAGLSCHVPNIVAITILLFGWEQNEISITFELWWKNC